jgi:serine protease DegQ
MKRKALYSRATRARSAASSVWVGDKAGGNFAPNLADDFNEGPSAFAIAWTWIKRFYVRHERPLLMAFSVLISLAVIGAYSLMHPAPRALTQTDIDGAVQYTMANSPRPPAMAARAADIISPSVVEVEGYLSPEHATALAKEAAKDHKKLADAVPQGSPDKPLTPGTKDDPEPDSIGSGVVIDEDGQILTSLHVISSTDRWVVVFSDGSKSDAEFVGAQPENDLAVIKAKILPDDLQPAILASAAGLRPGDEVVATGFPFGIGPSVTSGVVSGLKREFVDPENNRPKLSNLIQFDAAVNPGNSGGPLVNRDGEVVGIVAAIVNPSAHVFAGIGFAVPIENAARAAGDNPL